MTSLEVLHVADCPNLAAMLDRVREASDLPVITRLVRTEEEAAQWGMAGSPTLLIDGLDPFADEQGCGCGVACRLYRDESGRVMAAPSVQQIRDALAAQAAISSARG